MEFWKEVRRHVLTNELSQRAACEKYRLGWHTLKKILGHAEPPGYRQRQPRPKRKLEPFLPIIHQILEADRQAPKKPRRLTPPSPWPRRRSGSTCAAAVDATPRDLVSAQGEAGTMRMRGAPFLQGLKRVD